MLNIEPVEKSEAIALGTAILMLLLEFLAHLPTRSATRRIDEAR